MRIYLCLILIAGTASAEPCPRGLLDPTHDTLTLPRGCRAPFTGQLYTLSAHDGIAQDLAALDQLIRDQRIQLTEARGARDACSSQRAEDMRGCAAQLMKLSAAIKKIPPPVADQPLSPVSWAAIGALSGAVPLAIGEAAGASGFASGGAALISASLALGLAWWMGD